MYNLKSLNGKFATDTFYLEQKLLKQNVCAQVFSHKGGSAVVYPMKEVTSNSIGQALKDFLHDFWVPERLTFDGPSAQISSDTLP